MLILVVIRNLLTAPVSSPFTDSFVLITPCSLPERVGWRGVGGGQPGRRRALPGNVGVLTEVGG